MNLEVLVLKLHLTNSRFSSTFEFKKHNMASIEKTKKQVISKITISLASPEMILAKIKW